MYDVAIIGAGITGCMTARLLARYDISVVLIEKENDVAVGATKANSAIVHAGYDAKEGSLKARLNLSGSEQMEKIAKELGVKYERNGSLVIGFSERDRASLDTLLRRGNANGVPGLRILEKEELHEKEPRLSDDVTCALYAPTGAIVCPYELAIAACGNAMDNGASLLLGFEVTGISEKGDVYELASKTKTVEARYVVNAAGLFADRIAKMVGDDSFEIRPRRGEYILFDKECGGLVSHTVFRVPSEMGKGILVTKTVDGNLLIGPTSENISDKEDTATTAEGLSRVLSEADRNVKGLPKSKCITSFTGLRAVGSTGDFILTSPKPRFVNAAGIESPGLSASPAIAEYLVEMLRRSGLSLVEKKNYQPNRESYHLFSTLSDEEKQKWIARDPAYGRIVCRCEGVTEGEILEAIRRNPRPRDTDGVKRRTRAQMGRCQGGFCLPTVTELLARELGIPESAVTKKGNASLWNQPEETEVGV